MTMSPARISKALKHKGQGPNLGLAEDKVDLRYTGKESWLNPVIG